MKTEDPGVLHWLRHAGVPVARPGLLQVALAGLLLTTLAYLGLMLTDDTFLGIMEKHGADSSLTPEGMALVRRGFIAQSLFLNGLLLVGWFGLVRGWRFARLVWLLLLGLVALADLWRLLLPAIPLLVSLLLGTELGGIPREQWLPVLAHLSVAAAFIVLSFLLFLTPAGRWYRALRQAAAPKS
ncbi:hypothetical protein [Azovibrio restrictus]|uniref:hypothetical protein n=1 Tax=Azovibrio restrictus TaxID=146938 RepID=UPI0026EEE535|nr:hypothetical protein [Azovibrio restrictus]MDD3482430.1 hypothetical protein [Azovibrio restrictus]